MNEKKEEKGLLEMSNFNKMLNILCASNRSGGNEASSRGNEKPTGSLFIKFATRRCEELSILIMDHRLYGWLNVKGWLKSQAGWYSIHCLAAEVFGRLYPFSWEQPFFFFSC